MEVTVDSSGARRMLDRVYDAVGQGVHSRFQLLGRTLRDELRPQIPKKTGRARGSIFFRLDSVDREETLLLVGGDLVQAPHLIYIEHGRGKERGKTGPIRRFQDRNEERIQGSIADAVGQHVRAAGGND
jgi:hypothetical protein